MNGYAVLRLFYVDILIWFIILNNTISFRLTLHNDLIVSKYCNWMDVLPQRTNMKTTNVSFWVCKAITWSQMVRNRIKWQCPQDLLENTIHCCWKQQAHRKYMRCILTNLKHICCGVRVCTANHKLALRVCRHVRLSQSYWQKYDQGLHYWLHT